ncbi:MAG: PilZ domain-containing protein [Myxococcota bacterium]
MIQVLPSARRSLRRSVRVETWLSVEETGSGYGIIEDISISGTWIATTAGASVGSAVVVEFSLGGQRFYLPGTVVRVSESGLGAEFLYEDEVLAECIARIPVGHDPARADSERELRVETAIAQAVLDQGYRFRESGLYPVEPSVIDLDEEATLESDDCVEILPIESIR